MNCLTCHDPHREVDPNERADHYRAICLSCHAPDGCGLPQPERTRRAADDCTRCHMPDSATEVPHVAFTHHRIGIHSSTPAEPHSRTRDTAAGALIPIHAPDLPAVEQVRLLGLAHFMQFKASEGSGDGAQHRRAARRLLDEALRGGAGDPPVRAALAEFAAREQDAATAAALAESVLAEGDRGTRAWVDAASLLAEAAFARGEFTRARELYAQLATQRHDARYWFFLGLCEQNCGRTDAAIQALEKSLQIDPVQTGAHQMLAALHQRAGRPSSAIDHQRTAASIERFLRHLEAPLRANAPPPGHNTLHTETPAGLPGR